MSLSFADSLRTNRVGSKSYPNSANAGNSITEDGARVYGAESWVLDDRYKYLAEYIDESLSIVDAEKNISVDHGQINLTREDNSQFIPFIMPRYYDGFDLSTTKISFYYVNKNNYDNYSDPINVYYSDSQIKFGWLIDKYVTAVEGTVRFEIHATGTNSHGDEYVWKSRPCDGINVLKSLCGSAPIELEGAWITRLIEQITPYMDKKLEKYCTKEDVEVMIEGFNSSAIVAVAEALDAINGEVV